MAVAPRLLERGRRADRRDPEGRARLLRRARQRGDVAEAVIGAGRADVLLLQQKPQLFQPLVEPRHALVEADAADRKSVGTGKRCSVRVESGGRRFIKKKK